MEVVRLLKRARKSILLPLLFALPMSAHAGLMLTIDNLGTAGIDFTAMDQGANDRAPEPLNHNLLSSLYVDDTGSVFIITASSGAPDDGMLVDTNASFRVAEHSEWEIIVSDDSYMLGDITTPFESLVTPTLIRSGLHISLNTYVDGQLLLSVPTLQSGVSHSNMLPITLNEPSLIQHVVRISGGSTETLLSTFDTSTVAVAEPGPLTLLGCALLVLGWWRRKTR